MSENVRISNILKREEISYGLYNSNFMCYTVIISVSLSIKISLMSLHFQKFKGVTMLQVCMKSGESLFVVSADDTKRLVNVICL